MSYLKESLEFLIALAQKPYLGIKVPCFELTVILKMANVGNYTHRNLTCDFHVLQQIHDAIILLHLYLQKIFKTLKKILIWTYMIWGRVQPHLVVDTILLDVLFDLARIHPTTAAAVLGLTLNNLDAWFSIRTKWKDIRKVALLHNEIFFTLIFCKHTNTKLWPINFTDPLTLKKCWRKVRQC